MNKKVIFAHPTGNANSRAAIEGLCDAAMLGEFHTAVATYPGNAWSVLSRTSMGRELSRRQFPTKAQSVTRQRPLRELLRIASGKLKLTSLTRHETGLCCVDAIYRDLDRQVTKRLNHADIQGVYAYEDGALTSFRQAKKLGLICLYDLPIGYWRTAHRLLAEERERWPKFAPTLGGFSDSPEKLQRKDEEIRLSDHIFVASRFTQTTLDDCGDLNSKVHVIPYGYPQTTEHRDYDDPSKRKLKLLFVGGLSQRKGIADVFAVAERLADHVQLTVVGRGKVDDCPALQAGLKLHRWIPSLPHDKVIESMKQHDVLLFPSLFEGFGLVITEAMSQGTPVITTDRTAGPDLIEHDHNGWLIEAGCTNALLRQVESLIQSPDKISRVGEQARRTAAARPWSVYGRELAERVQECLVDTATNPVPQGSL